MKTFVQEPLENQAELGEVKIVRMPLGIIQANCYIVYREGQKAAMVVDPGAEPERIMQKLEELGLNCELIALTHRHHDHVGASAALAKLCKAPVVIGLYDSKAAQDPEQTLLMNYGKSREEALKYCAPHPEKELVDGEKLIVGSMHFTVMETPGHTAGGICLKGEGMLISGDTLFKGSMGRTDLPSGDERAMMRSLYRLAQLNPATKVYPGHGQSSTIGEELQSNQFLRFAANNDEFAMA